MKLAITMGTLLIGSFLSAAAIAQSKGEADPDQAKSVQTKPATKEQKAAAKADRRAEGGTTARTHPTGDDSPSSTGTRKAATPEQRKEARAERKVEGAATARTHPMGDDSPSSAGERRPSKTN